MKIPRSAGRGKGEEGGIVLLPRGLNERRHCFELLCQLHSSMQYAFHLLGQCEKSAEGCR